MCATVFVHLGKCAWLLTVIDDRGIVMCNVTNQHDMIDYKKGLHSFWIC